MSYSLAANELRIDDAGGDDRLVGEEFRSSPMRVHTGGNVIGKERSFGIQRESVGDSCTIAQVDSTKRPTDGEK